jgi:hypothetical protein
MWVPYRQPTVVMVTAHQKLAPIPLYRGATKLFGITPAFNAHSSRPTKSNSAQLAMRLIELPADKCAQTLPQATLGLCGTPIERPVW